jgi:putative flavoprotein involved in K+ transport
MPRVPVTIIGAGQAGLAVSHLLTAAGIDHVVLERGRIAQRWHQYSWESLRLLTPNWLSRLPGYTYTGRDPAGFMTAHEVARYLRSYAEWSGAPVVSGADVVSVSSRGDAYELVTSAGCWIASAVVIATGWADDPHVPTLARGLDSRIVQLTPAAYQNPAALSDGGVLVVGASATGVQLADEIAGSGRPVVLAVGGHTRLPRRYRGLDIMWWLDAMGILERRLDEHPDRAAARAESSLQLAGHSDGHDVDLHSLQGRGVVLAGRLAAAEGRRAAFAEDLVQTTRLADRRLHRLLDRIDGYAAAAGLLHEIDDPAAIRGIGASQFPAEVDLHHAGIRTVIWATGYRRAYPWLRVPVLDPGGDIQHTDGSSPAAGLYVIGMRWQSRRNSSFLDGVRHDAATVVSQVLDHLGATVGRVA